MIWFLDKEEGLCRQTYNIGDAVIWHKHYSWGHSKTYMLAYILSGLSQVGRHSMPLKIAHCG